MSENIENQQVQTSAQVKDKIGCMAWLGILLMTAAVLAAAWYFIAKPALEEKGIDVEGKIGEIRKHSVQAIDKTRSTLNSAGENIAGKYSELKNTAGKVAESETVEKIREGADKFKKSETAAGIVEKTKKIGEDVAEKAGDGGSWY